MNKLIFIRCHHNHYTQCKHCCHIAQTTEKEILHFYLQIKIFLIIQEIFYILLFKKMKNEITFSAILCISIAFTACGDNSSSSASTERVACLFTYTQGTPLCVESFDAEYLCKKGKNYEKEGTFTEIVSHCPPGECFKCKDIFFDKITYHYNDNDFCQNGNKIE